MLERIVKMKLVIGVGLLAFLLSVGVTMFFTGTFNRINAQATSEVVQNEKTDQKIAQPIAKSDESQSNANSVVKTENPIDRSSNKALEMQVEKYKAETAAEEAKLASVKFEVESLKSTKSSVDKYQQLAKIYGSMKSEDAATVLCELEPSMTEQLLSKMSDRTAGKIMGAIAAQNPTYAAKVSKILANAGSTSFE